MALLIEAMQVHEFVHADHVTPKQGATLAEVVSVMDEACMQRLTPHTWTPGPGTLAWWTRWMCGPAHTVGIPTLGHF